MLMAPYYRNKRKQVDGVIISKKIESGDGNDDDGEDEMRTFATKGNKNNQKFVLHATQK